MSIDIEGSKCNVAMQDFCLSSDVLSVKLAGRSELVNIYLTLIGRVLSDREENAEG